jgi:hypothetical protein
MILEIERRTVRNRIGPLTHGHHLAGWALQESAVSPKDLLLSVTGKLGKVRRKVYYGVVMMTDVHDDERTA